MLDVGSIRSSIRGNPPHAALAIANPFSRSVLPVGPSEDAVPYWLDAEHSVPPGLPGKLSGATASNPAEIANYE